MRQLYPDPFFMTRRSLPDMRAYVYGGVPDDAVQLSSESEASSDSEPEPEPPRFSDGENSEAADDDENNKAAAAVSQAAEQESAEDTVMGAWRLESE